MFFARTEFAFAGERFEPCRLLGCALGGSVWAANIERKRGGSGGRDPARGARRKSIIFRSLGLSGPHTHTSFIDRFSNGRESALRKWRPPRHAGRSRVRAHAVGVGDSRLLRLDYFSNLLNTTVTLTNSLSLRRPV